MPAAKTTEGVFDQVSVICIDTVTLQVNVAGDVRQTAGPDGAADC